jgi:anaerobic ribonucleoside-triphosphate reductase activating protein
MIKYHSVSVEENDLLYGPGKRLVIWVQGCSIHCDGCTNEHLWDMSQGKGLSAEELAAMCLDSKVALDGITLHGGEPTEQFKELMPAIVRIKAAGKSVILFTGYEIEELTSPEQKEFLSLCDIIICGRFDITKLNRYLHFRGSDNQRVIINSKRFKNYRIKDGQNTVLLQVDSNGEIACKGFPDEDMTELLSKNKQEKS